MPKMRSQSGGNSGKKTSNKTFNSDFRDINSKWKDILHPRNYAGKFIHTPDKVKPPKNQPVTNDDINKARLDLGAVNVKSRTRAQLEKALNPGLLASIKQLYPSYTKEDIIRLASSNPEAYKALLKRAGEANLSSFEKAVSTQKPVTPKTNNEKSVNKVLNESADFFKKVVSKIGGVNLETPSEKSHYFSLNTGQVHIPKSHNFTDKDEDTLIRHEVGHLYDWVLGGSKDKNLWSSNKDFAKAVDADSKQLTPERWAVVKNFYTKKDYGENTILAIRDIASALSIGVLGGETHSKAYFANPRNRQAEIFANITALMADPVHGQDFVKLLNYLAPQALAAYSKATSEFIKSDKPVKPVTPQRQLNTDVAAQLLRPSTPRTPGASARRRPARTPVTPRPKFTPTDHREKKIYENDGTLRKRYFRDEARKSDLQELERILEKKNIPQPTKEYLKQPDFQAKLRYVYELINQSKTLVNDLQIHKDAATAVNLPGKTAATTAESENLAKIYPTLKNILATNVAATQELKTYWSTPDTDGDLTSKRNSYGFTAEEKRAIDKLFSTLSATPGDINTYYKQMLNNRNTMEVTQLTDAEKKKYYEDYVIAKETEAIRNAYSLYERDMREANLMTDPTKKAKAIADADALLNRILTVEIPQEKLAHEAYFKIGNTSILVKDVKISASRVDPNEEFAKDRQEAKTLRDTRLEAAKSLDATRNPADRLYLNGNVVRLNEYRKHLSAERAKIVNPLQKPIIDAENEEARLLPLVAKASSDLSPKTKARVAIEALKDKANADINAIKQEIIDVNNNTSLSPVDKSTKIAKLENDKTIINTQRLQHLADYKLAQAEEAVLKAAYTPLKAQYDKIKKEREGYNRIEKKADDDYKAALAVARAKEAIHLPADSVAPVYDKTTGIPVGAKKQQKPITYVEAILGAKAAYGKTVSDLIKAKKNRLAKAKAPLANETFANRRTIIDLPDEAELKRQLKNDYIEKGRLDDSVLKETRNFFNLLHKSKEKAVFGANFSGLDTHRDIEYHHPNSNWKPNTEWQGFYWGEDKKGRFKMSPIGIPHDEVFFMVAQRPGKSSTLTHHNYYAREGYDLNNPQRIEGQSFHFLHMASPRDFMGHARLNWVNSEVDYYNPRTLENGRTATYDELARESFQKFLDANKTLTPAYFDTPTTPLPDFSPASIDAYVIAKAREDFIDKDNFGKGSGNSREGEEYGDLQAGKTISVAINIELHERLTRVYQETIAEVTKERNALSREHKTIKSKGTIDDAVLDALVASDAKLERLYRAYHIMHLKNLLELKKFNDKNQLVMRTLGSALGADIGAGKVQPYNPKRRPTNFGKVITDNVAYEAAIDLLIKNGRIRQ